MYKPKYSYLFCISRMRGLWLCSSLIKYLNSVGIQPYIVIRLDETNTAIENSGCKIKRVHSLPDDYDIMFTEGAGVGMGDGEYELIKLRESRDKKKINLSLHFPSSIEINTENPFYNNAKEDGLYGLCLDNERSVMHHRRFLKNLHLLNTGNPDWDNFKTDEYKKEVAKWKEKLGNKVLVLGVEFTHSNSLPWCEMIIKYAEQKGFKVVLRCHPDRHRFMPQHYLKYWHKEVHRYILGNIGTHYICENPCSTSVVESFFTGMKVGGSPLVVHYKGWGKHLWIEEKNKWEKMINEITESDKVPKMIPLINNEESLNNFLSDKKPIVSFEEARDFLSWSIVPNYCEHFFDVVERDLS